MIMERRTGRSIVMLDFRFWYRSGHFAEDSMLRTYFESWSESPVLFRLRESCTREGWLVAGGFGAAGFGTGWDTASIGWAIVE
jgi:hypothetical protein